MEPSHRSIVPNIPGVPWWAAVLIAVGATAVGYAFDAGHKELTHTFAGFYIAGCVAAVLAVRQAAVFTAVIQPPLILFCAVPGAYWLFHGGKVDKFKDLLINCGYPLIERFPLMLGTAGGVLLIGMIRWFLGKNARTTAPATGDATTKDATATSAERTPADRRHRRETELAAGARSRGRRRLPVPRPPPAHAGAGPREPAGPPAAAVDRRTAAGPNPLPARSTGVGRHVRTWWRTSAPHRPEKFGAAHRLHCRLQPGRSAA